MRKIEKIALVFFPINDVGGVITWNKHIQTGFRRLGIETMYFYATPGNIYGCDPSQDIKKERYTMLAGWHLSYNNKNLKKSLEILNSFDAVIFTKSSPHPTKDNIAKTDITNWVALYTEVHVPKVVVFHDALWEKTNYWSKDVADYVDICIGAQKKFMHSVEQYPADCIKYWDYFPMDLESIKHLNLRAKENFGMVATQWIKWKNHHKLLPQLPKIKVPIYLFGAGMEWHYLKKTSEYLAGIGKDFKMTEGVLRKKHGDDFNYLETLEMMSDHWDAFSPDQHKEMNDSLIIHNPESLHVMFGSVMHDILELYYAKALFSLDLSTRGYTNYTHFEPLAYRTFSMIEERVLADPDCTIPEDCCLSYRLDELFWQVDCPFDGYLDLPENGAVKKHYNRILDNGEKFVQRMACEQVAQRIVEAIQKI